MYADDYGAYCDEIKQACEQIGYDGYFTFEVGRIFTPASRRRPAIWNNLSVSPAENLASDCVYMLEKYPEN